MHLMHQELQNDPKSRRTGAKWADLRALLHKQQLSPGLSCISVPGDSNGPMEHGCDEPCQPRESGGTQMHENVELSCT
jgi:hypothetical protein